MKLIATCLAAVVFGQHEADGFWKTKCCRRYRVDDNSTDPIYDGLYELVGKYPEDSSGRPLFQHEDEKLHLYYTPDLKLWRLGTVKEESDLDYMATDKTDGCPNLGEWGDDVVLSCDEKVKTTKQPGTGPTKPGPTKPGPTKPGPTRPGPKMCCTSYDVVDKRPLETEPGQVDVSGTYEMVTDEKKNDRPIFKNVDEFMESSGLFFHMWFQPDQESWQIGDKDGLFEVPTITASEPSHCPLNGDWGDGLEVTCAARPPKPTPKPTGPPKHECCKRYSVEGDEGDWKGMYLFKGMMNEAPIYVNPDHMFGVTKMLYLCDECKKWVFGFTKDPTDVDTLISAEVAKCPHEADFGDLKVNCLEDEDKPEAETCLLKKTAETGKCADIGNQCNMKTTELTDANNEGSRATVACRQHYRMNLPYDKDPFVYGKQTTYAYCKCKNGQCGWEFTKGAVQCTLCPVEQLQARNGKKQKFIEWETGIAIYYPIKVDVRATEGWHVALDFNAEIGNFTRPDEIVDVDIVDAIDKDKDKDKDQDKDKKPGPDKKPGQTKKCAVRSGNMKLTSVSKNGRMWTFTPNVASLSPSTWSGDKKVYLLAYFDNMTKDDIEKAKKATLLFFKFKMPRSSASCLVDRFDRYPLQPDEEDDDEDEKDEQ